MNAELASRNPSRDRQGHQSSALRGVRLKHIARRRHSELVEGILSLSKDAALRRRRHPEFVEGILSLSKDAALRRGRHPELVEGILSLSKDVALRQACPPHRDDERRFGKLSMPLPKLSMFSKLCRPSRNRTT
jgi:hypothetical protein